MRELLLLLCRYPYYETNRGNLSNLLREVQDWHALIELINNHGIIALAAYNIREAGLENEVPEDAMTILENGYRQSMVRNIWLTERWKEVNTILCNAGIKHILLKGMALEYTIYGAKGLRQMNDNDILVNRENAIKAWQLLQQNGFELKTAKSALHKKILLEIAQHLPTLYKEGYAVEIHTRLSDAENTSEPDYHKLFDEAVEITVDNQKAFILPRKIHLKYLIRHFNRHAIAGECQLRSYSDIILPGNDKAFEFPDQFILNPSQKKIKRFRKAIYKVNVHSVLPKYRLRFILGDLFPSIIWMKERYKCGGIKVLLFYPHRLGKLLWLW